MRASWDEVQRLFLEVLDQPDSERGSWLAQHTDGDHALADEVRAMVEAHEGEGLKVEGRLVPEAVERSLAPGTRFGVWVVESPIGQGGMGDVYRVHRGDGTFEQAGALKVMRPGFPGQRLARRFQAERQILARLTHPDIVPILDGGVGAAGQPFLVLQYVDGRPITEACRAVEADLGRRLELFLRVCRAVEYAHGRLVVHRDIKPSNILVTDDGQPKLLDFGIAKLIDPDTSDADAVTAVEQRVLTLEYAAPEQVRGEPATTAADIYALGVLLFELLTGERPFELAGRSRRSLERAVLEEEAPPLDRPPTRSGVEDALPVPRRRLKGDLARIVAKALRKDPERRYASAGALADDVERFQAGLPVRARPDSLAYRTRRFVQRNRAAATALVALMAALVVFALASRAQARQTAHERDRAEAERAQAEAVVTLLTDLLEASNPTIVPGGDTLRIGWYVDEAERMVEGLHGQPLLQARMWRVLGNMHDARSGFERARTLLGRSLEAQVVDSSGGALERIRTRIELGRVEARMDRARGQVLLETAVDSLERLLSPEDPELADALQLLGLTLFDEPERARDLLDRASAIQASAAGVDSLGVAAALNAMGQERFGRWRLTEALELFRSAGRILDRVLPPEHPHRLAVLTNELASLGALGRTEGLADRQRELVRTTARVQGDSVLSYWIRQEHLAVTLAGAGRLDEASQLLRETRQGMETLFGPEHWRSVNTARNQAMVALSARRPQEALDHLQPTFGPAGETESTVSRYYRTGQRGLIQLALGRTADAARDVTLAVDSVLPLLPEGHRYHGEILTWSAIVALAMGETERVGSLLAAADSVFARALPVGHPKRTEVTCLRDLSTGSPGAGCSRYLEWGLAHPWVVDRILAADR